MTNRSTHLSPAAQYPQLEKLFNNHLAFARTHGRTVERRQGAILIDSSRPDFVCAVLEDAPSISAVPDRFRTVRLLPWSRLGPSDLLACRFEAKGALSYMRLTALPALAVTGLAIERVRSNAQMDVFSNVQTRAFLQEGESFETWYPWLRAQNGANLVRPEQRFYIASLEEMPVGVAFTIAEEDTLGIYGVATLPDHRRRGTSSALLAHAVREGRGAGAETVTLQAKTGSYAESLYAKLGFETAFVSPIFVRGT